MEYNLQLLPKLITCSLESVCVCVGVWVCVCVREREREREREIAFEHIRSQHFEDVTNSCELRKMGKI